MAKSTAEEKAEFAAIIVKRQIWFFIITAILYFLLIWFIWLIPYQRAGVVILVLYTLAGFRIFGPDEVGAGIFLGAGTFEFRHRFGWMPPFLGWIIRAPAVQIRRRIGTPPTTTKGEIVEVKDVPEAYYYTNTDPMRITFATPETINKDLIKDAGDMNLDPTDPLNQRLTPDPNLVMTWKIGNFLRFLEEVGSIEAANQYIDESGGPALAQICGQITPAMAVRFQSQMEKLVSRKVEIAMGEYDDPDATKPTDTGDEQPRFTWLGIDFKKVQVTTWGWPREVNRSQASARAAGFEAQGTVNTARGNRQKLILESQGQKRKLINEGAGAAQAREDFLTAEAIGAEQLADKTGTPAGLIVAWMNTMRQAFTNAQYSILPGSQNMLSPEAFTTAAAGIAETLKRLDQTGGSKQKPTTTAAST